MKRKWNWPLWIGFVVAVSGLFSYEFFAQFPVTRDFPWANLLLFGVAGILLMVGLFRAFGRPQIYRGRIFGSIFTGISLCLFAFFAYELFYVVRQVPLSAQAPHVGQQAPAFKLPDQNGKRVALAQLLSPNGAILIFYRGHWWPLCNSELRSFQRRLSDFTARGVHVAAISVDSVSVNETYCRKMGFTYPFLSDASAEVIRRYDVLHRGAGPKGSDIARPAEFFIDRSGTVQWVNLTDNITVRARPEEVLRAIDDAMSRQ